MVEQLVKASTVRGDPIEAETFVKHVQEKQIDVESYIIVSLELALLKARHGEWIAAERITDGLWSPFMARQREVVIR